MRKKSQLGKIELLRAALILFASAVLAHMFVWLFLVKDFSAITVKDSYVFIIILSLFCTVGIYLYFTDLTAIKNVRKLLLLCTIMLLSLVLLITVILVFGPTFVPVALCALLITLFFGGGTAVCINFTTALILSVSMWIYHSAIDEQMMFILIGSVFNGMIASALTSKHSNRLRYCVVALWLGSISVGLYLLINSLQVAKGIIFDWDGILILLQCFISGPINVMLFFLLTPLLEVSFNVTTNVRLAELTSTAHPLIKRLYNEAPGTFNHSLTTANYAEACAAAIGENTYLARAVAYYHDIGKLKNPQYFKENQLDGYNPHDEIPPELSASFLKKHVLDGMMLALEHRLPVQIRDAIVEHHGTTLIRYFYFKAQKYSEHELPEADYSYDGSTPKTKISAILMICDGCEAALRTLSSEEKHKAYEVVDGLIKERMRQKQFDLCPITMEDLNLIGRSIVTTYMGVTHERIKYPDAKGGAVT